MCIRRTPLGACAEYGSESKAAAAPAPVVRVQSAPAAPAEEESELVKGLLARSAANKEANERLVKEKTLKNGLSGTFGPFAKDAPVMKADGTFEIIRIAKLEKWKDSGKIIVSKNGLDTWAPGFENAAAVEEAEAAARANKKGFFGLF